MANIILFWLGKGNNPEVTGDCVIRGYEKWLRCESCDIEFDIEKLREREEKAREEAEKEDDDDEDQSSSLRSTTTKPKSKPLELSASISRSLDVASPELMLLWLQQLIRQTGEQPRFTMEVHLVESGRPMVAGMASSSTPFKNPKTKAISDVRVLTRFLFDGVVVSGWSMSSSEEKQPTEKVSFRFNAFALDYCEPIGADDRRTDGTPVGWRFGPGGGSYP